MTFQLEKIYDPTNEEDDMVEMEEERLRMREHVMNEVVMMMPIRAKIEQFSLHEPQEDHWKKIYNFV